jgi:hypothetical protein
MGCKVKVDGRTVTLQDAQWALDKALESDKFSRHVFPGNGLQGLLHWKSRRPASPKKHVRLWGLANTLATDIGDKRQSDFKRRRDEAMIHALTSIPQSADYTVPLNGKKYVLIDKGDFRYTYIDVSQGSAYELKKICQHGLPHVFFEQEDLGRIIVNTSNLQGWRGLTHDEADVKNT